jgi:hypothetical protein
MSSVSEMAPPLLAADEEIAQTSPGKRFFGWCRRVARILFGFATLVVCLALISAVPILNLLSLGFLL